MQKRVDSQLISTNLAMTVYFDKIELLE